MAIRLKGFACVEYCFAGELLRLSLSTLCEETFGLLHELLFSCIWLCFGVDVAGGMGD